jgi:hypothetical protein
MGAGEPPNGSSDGATRNPKERVCRAERLSRKTLVQHSCGLKRAGTVAAGKPLTPSDVIAFRIRGSGASQACALGFSPDPHTNTRALPDISLPRQSERQEFEW